MPTYPLRVLWLALIFLISRPSTLWAQQVIPLPAAVLSLRRMSRDSGYIFSGTVTRVELVKTNRPQDISIVLVTFHVQRAIAGVRRGQNLTIREWEGRWQSGERYSVGERAFVFLYRPSRLGLTSSVGGKAGRFAYARDGTIAPNYAQLEMLKSAGVRTAVWSNEHHILPKQFGSLIRSLRQEED